MKTIYKKIMLVLVIAFSTGLAGCSNGMDYLNQMGEHMPTYEKMSRGD